MGPEEDPVARECTLSDQELADLCSDWVSKLCASGGTAFTMTVPVRLNYDTDMVFSELIERFRLLAGIENVVKTGRFLSGHIVKKGTPKKIQ
jgi:hypothetical protein